MTQEPSDRAIEVHNYAAKAVQSIKEDVAARGVETWEAELGALGTKVAGHSYELELAQKRAAAKYESKRYRG